MKLVEIEGAGCDIYAGRKAGSVLEGLLRGAEASIRVYSPFLSPMVAGILKEKAGRIPVEVFTTKAKGNRPHAKALRRLKGPGGILKWLFGRSNVEVRLLPDSFHAKVFFIDDVAVFGSANLTYSGMRRNFEVVIVCRDPDAVMEMDRHFAESFG